MEEAAVAAGTKPPEDTLAAVKVDDNSDALIDVIPLKDSNNLINEGDKDSQENKLEE